MIKRAQISFGTPLLLKVFMHLLPDNDLLAPYLVHLSVCGQLHERCCR